MGSVSLIDGHIDETNVEKFIRIAEDNPNLPIVPMVDHEVVGEECGRWVGSFGDCYVGEFAIHKDHYYTDREEFKEDYYGWNDDELCDRFGYDPWITEYGVSRGLYSVEQLQTNKENEKKMEEYLDRIADSCFIKAIIVCIDMPEVWG